MACLLECQDDLLGKFPKDLIKLPLLAWIQLSTFILALVLVCCLTLCVLIIIINIHHHLLRLSPSWWGLPANAHASHNQKRWSILAWDSRSVLRQAIYEVGVGVGCGVVQEKMLFPKHGVMTSTSGRDHIHKSDLKLQSRSCSCSRVVSCFWNYVRSGSGLGKETTFQFSSEKSEHTLLPQSVHVLVHFWIYGHEHEL